jgi:hypothetical protein
MTNILIPTNIGYYADAERYVFLPLTTLIDTGCIQANLIHSSKAKPLVTSGLPIHPVDIRIRPGVGQSSFAVTGMIECECTLRYKGPTGPTYTTILIRALISDDITFDLILGLPTITQHNLFHLLHVHLSSANLCEICANYNIPNRSDNNVKLNQLTIRTDHPDPTVSDSSELTEIFDRIHISDIFQTEPDDDDIPDDDIAEALSTPTTNDDYKLVTIDGSPELQTQLRQLCSEFSDIFCMNVRAIPADVPPLHYEYDRVVWNRPGNRLPARNISPEKQIALSDILDELLKLGVIRPSTANAWSQVHLVRKPKGGFRCTIDFRGINKAIVNQGWQLPNIQQMLTRIGSKKPRIFGIADMTSGYWQMPLHPDCCPSTAFITYRGLYEWTRVPQGMILSANYFQRMMTEEVLRDLMYDVCEDYIDDILTLGTTPENFLIGTRRLFQRARDKRVALRPDKVTLGVSKVEFVGHDIDSDGINMSKKRIESTVDIRAPENLTELYQFLGVVNFFHNHIPMHSDISRPLTQMIVVANKSKHIIWTDAAHVAFHKLKDLVNSCPKLYYVDYTLPIYLCTDASDYAIGAYLYQS